MVMKLKVIVMRFTILLAVLLNSQSISYSQIWDSCGTDIRGNGGYAREHWGKLFVRIRDTIDGKFIYNFGTFDSTQWDTLLGGVDGAVYGSAEFNNKIFISGGINYFNGPWPGWPVPPIYNLATWDGSQYNGLGLPSIPPSGISTLQVYNNELFAGFQGQMTISGQAFNCIFRYNDTTFNTVGGGVSGAFKDVNALTKYNGYLIVGGYFNYAGSLPVNNIARWNGSQWSNISNGLSYDVKSFLVDTVNNILYAGGAFSHAFNQNDTITVNFIAKYDGTQWSSLGNGMIGSVFAMALYKGNLYAGTSGFPSGSLWKWDGTNWSAVVPSPFGGAITCLTVYKDQLYVSGGFNSIGGVPYAGFARYTDTTTVGLPSSPVQNENNFTIHPNPAKNKISLTFGQPVNGRVDVAIYNAKGDMILRKQFAIVQEQITIDLPVGSKSGMYLCKITGKGIEMSGKFVIE